MWFAGSEDEQRVREGGRGSRRRQADEDSSVLDYTYGETDHPDYGELGLLL